VRIEGQIISIEPGLDWGYFATDDGEVNGFRLSVLGTDDPSCLGSRVLATVENDRIVKISMVQAAENSTLSAS